MQTHVLNAIYIANLPFAITDSPLTKSETGSECWMTLCWKKLKITLSKRICTPITMSKVIKIKSFNFFPIVMYYVYWLFIHKLTFEEMIKHLFFDHFLTFDKVIIDVRRIPHKFIPPNELLNYNCSIYCSMFLWCFFNLICCFVTKFQSLLNWNRGFWAFKKV